MLKREIAEKARTGLSSADTVQEADMLTILIGRVLYIGEANETGKAVRQEIEQIVDGVIAVLQATRENEVKEAALDVLRYLPVRSADEIAYVVRLAEGTTDSSVQEACAYALLFADKEKDDVKAALEMAKRSRVEAIRRRAEEMLERRW